MTWLALCYYIFDFDPSLYYAGAIDVASIIAISLMGTMYLSAYRRKRQMKMTSSSDHYVKVRRTIENLLDDVLPSAVRYKLETLPPSRWHEVSSCNDEVTIVFVSISNFDEISATSSDRDLVMLMNDLMCTIDHIIKRHQKDQFSPTTPSHHINDMDMNKWPFTLNDKQNIATRPVSSKPKSSSYVTKV